jgi:hypothetical protein
MARIGIKGTNRRQRRKQRFGSPQISKIFVTFACSRKLSEFPSVEKNISAGAARFRKNEKSYLLEDRAAFSSKSRKHDGSGAGVTRQTQ